MFDDKGNKFLLIKFSDNFDGENRDSDWSLVENNDDFSYTYWFSYSDYEIYKPYEIKSKFYSKSTKLSENKLISNGYLKVIGETYEWAYEWFCDLIQEYKLKEYIEKLDDCKEFVKMSGIIEEIYIIEDWLRLDLAKKWCDRNGINYKIDIPNNYPQQLSKSIINTIKLKFKNIQFEYPFDFLNKEI